jgi:hypothetical protein
VKDRISSSFFSGLIGASSIEITGIRFPHGHMEEKRFSACMVGCIFEIADPLSGNNIF